MPTLVEVQRQIDGLEHKYIFWTQKEIRSLPDILDKDERILALTSGFMNSATWLAICTNKRVLFLNRGMIFGLRQLQIPLDRVQAIDHEYTVFFGSIRVWDGASYFTIGMVAKHSIAPFVKVTQDAMHAFRNQNTAKASGTTSGATDIASQLERLAALKEKGFLTEEEFQSQKRKLLG